MKKIFITLSLLMGLLFGQTIICAKTPSSVTLTKEQLQDKIKGGWAGQTIGCTYGFPTEFKFCGTMIQDYIPIHWNKGIVEKCYRKTPYAYDDVYMDLTFVDVFDRLGMDAPVDSFAMAFANAGYGLCHANQAARYNILFKGLKAPATGHWLVNPHADDLDFQIEADFAGLMTPGMVNSGVTICDSIGHIMNYGDGWYGGVFVSAMYSLAFVSDQPEFIVTEALKTIPRESKFYRCIRTVLDIYRKDDRDWKKAWFEVERNFSEDLGCPEGVMVPYNIDATVNSAYIAIGLLYGKGDYGRTLEISTRCGADSDCNPASAGGILGTMLGYSQIPEKWTNELIPVEDINYSYTHISLNKVYEMRYNHALEMIDRNGGVIEGDQVKIVYQKPQTVRFEQCFHGIRPVLRKYIGKPILKAGAYSFEGSGIAFRGNVVSPDKNYIAQVEFYVDGVLIEKAELPVHYRTRRYELFWTYELPQGKHTATFKWLNPMEDVYINLGDVIVYEGKPIL